MLKELITLYREYNLVMNGVLVIDKPENWTSHDVVAKCRKILATKRIGHTGTLDPFATGVMVLLIGKATRLARFLKDDKEYIATIRFGFETTTGDLTGQAKHSIKEVNLSEDEINSALSFFRGEIEQVPPMFSAKKLEGKKLYVLARQGVEVARRPVKVNIHELKLIKVLSPTDVLIRVACSAGTYIRVLAEQIGRELGIGAHLIELKRTRVGDFRLDQALTLEQLQTLFAQGKLRLISMNEALAHLKEMKLTPAEVARIKNGVPISKSNGHADDKEIIRLTSGDDLIAIAIFNGNIIQPKIVLV
ncbi:MAG: tRNA pseudouridine(55) synthase TruB [Acidobacteria bacterium]|nr:MAG: tRNA pseudouridine(55) synthase TruB [Acidobacteriota bacterium]